MYINNVDISQYGAYVRTGWGVTPGKVDREVYSPLTGTLPTIGKLKLGLEKVSVPIRVIGGSDNESGNCGDVVISMCTGSTVELVLPDGSTHTAVLTGISNREKKATGVLDLTLEFSAYKHGELQRVTGGTFYVYGTRPDMECSISCAVETPGDFSVAGITFSGCAAGDTLQIDGIGRRVLKNGAPVDLSTTNFVSFPMLHPEINTVACDTTPIVEYYPLYV